MDGACADGACADEACADEACAGRGRADGAVVVARVGRLGRGSSFEACGSITSSS